MGITYNPGSGLKTVSEIKINPNGTLRNVIEVWENVGGTLKQVWPDTAYDGSHFAGELRGGVINAPRNLRLGGTGDTYRWPNSANWGGATAMGQTITGGALTASKDSPFGDKDEYGPFFVSVGTIDFTKYSKVRIAGNFTATMRAYRSSGDASMDATIEPREYVKSGDYYNFVSYVKHQSTADISTKSTSWYTGTVNFDFTFDISSWTEKAGVFCLFANNNWYDVNSSTGGEYGSQALRLTLIKFIK